MADDEETSRSVSLSVLDARLLEQATISYLRLACNSQVLGKPLLSEIEQRRLQRAVVQLQMQLVKYRLPDRSRW